MSQTSKKEILICSTIHSGTDDLQTTGDIEDVRYAIGTLDAGVADPEDFLKADGHHHYNEIETRVVKKIDLYLLPLLILSYGFQFLDKTALTYAAVYGIQKGDHLVNQDYSWCSSIFYFGYLFWQYPGAYMLKFFDSSRYLGSIMAIWSVICILTSVTSNYAGLMVVRFFLGAVESVFAPAFLIIVASWYRREEQPIRQVLWFAGTPIFSIIGGIVAYGIGHANTSIAEWKLLFIIFGSITLFWGGFIFFFLPSSPANAWFFNKEEKEVSKQRLTDDGICNEKKWKSYQVKEALIDPKTWLCFFLSFITCIPAGGIGDFKTMIFQSLSLNKTPLHSVIMTFPGSAIQLVSLIFSGFIATKIKNSTLLTMSISTMPVIIGTALIHWLPDSNQWGRCAGLWISYTNTCALALNFAIIGSNVRGYTKKSVVSALNFIGYCVGSICSPHFFHAKERSMGYPTGIRAMFITSIISFFVPLVQLAHLMWENHRRNHLQANGIKEYDDEPREASDDLGDDKTDWEMKGFRYSY